MIDVTSLTSWQHIFADPLLRWCFIFVEFGGIDTCVICRGRPQVPRPLVYSRPSWYRGLPASPTYCRIKSLPMCPTNTLILNEISLDPFPSMSRICQKAPYSQGLSSKVKVEFRAYMLSCHCLQRVWTKYPNAMTKLSHQLFTQTEIHVDPAASQFRSRFWALPLPQWWGMGHI